MWGPFFLESPVSTLKIFTPADDAAWRVCRKTRPIRAKPMITIIVDRSVTTQFLLNTLEAREPVTPDAVMCIGDAGDAWQQSSKSLLKNYNVVSIDGDGWMMCEPKPEATREFMELTHSLLSSELTLHEGEGFILGKWGEVVDGVENLQRFRIGDFLLRQREDHTDTWIVRRKLWLNTYTEISA